MIMICCVHGCSDARYRGPLETMFEDRKRLFVDLLGWDLSVQDARWEIDQFDDDDAVYLIALDQTGDHAGSLRLLPSKKPQILSELFPELRSEERRVGKDWVISCRSRWWRFN